MVKKFIKKVTNFRFFKNLRNNQRSKNLAKNSKGQINQNTSSAELICNLITSKEINSVLEIGTWNGLGSTTTIYDCLDNVQNSFHFISIESDKYFYREAKNNFKGKSMIDIKLGRLFELNELPEISSIDFQKHGLIKENVEWFYQDLRRYRKIKNIYEELPPKFDFILFDGGEFSTFAEFKKLYMKTKYFALDDINTYKQFEVLRFINKNSKNFKEFSSSNNLKIFEVLT